MSKIDYNYYSMYLLNELKRNDDERQHDADFINGRADAAAAAAEDARLSGSTADQAQEIAMSVLLEGIDTKSTEQHEE